MKAGALRERMLQTMRAWNDSAAVAELEATDFDTACCQGAAYYGLVRRGHGIRIRGGVARSYYIGVESAMPAVPGLPAPLKALCVVPFGMEEGSEADVEGQRFSMTLGHPVTFRFLSSTTRKNDAMGTLLGSWSDDELEELNPIHTEFANDAQPAPGQQVPVTLHTKVTEVGTLDLELRSAEGEAWRLEYEVRHR